VNECPYDALKITGKWYGLEELIYTVTKDIKFYERSDGGITFSGGEPTCQIDFLEVLVNKLKEFNVHLCLETCGYFDYDKCIDTLREIDLIYFDLKILDNRDAELYTGKGINIIKKNLKKLAAEAAEKITVRLPLIPGITTKNNNLSRIRKILSDNKIGNIQLLPFHKFGLKKYEMLHKKKHLKNAKLLSEEEVNTISDFFYPFNVRVEQ
jgi:pyruvate formate lyase activating enzyme